ncbi:Clp protease N-terminal domain-containing protein [Mycobacterium sp. NPDC048908]|uniref:Clp protease N-terminal domain-containing protein n=1 Tax=Mycobacterium sp. NPDC048908 TaxID=3364292 RepID=UPI00371DFA6C
MFERFTEAARQSIVGSQREAKSLNQASVGAELLLVSVLDQQDPILGPIMESRGVYVGSVRQRVREICDVEGAPPGGHIPFSNDVKRALERSLRETLDLGQTDIGPVHLLLGLLADGDNTGVGILRDLNVDVAELAREIRAHAG